MLMEQQVPVRSTHLAQCRSQVDANESQRIDSSEGDATSAWLLRVSIEAHKSASGLTPELSRAALRPWAVKGSMDSTCTRPRSGLGLNELLGAFVKVLPSEHQS